SQLMPNGSTDPNVHVEVSTAGGTPLLQEEYDPAPESTSCSLRDLPNVLTDWQPTPTSTLLIRAKLSPKLVGYFANPFWLARHPTTE
ncbi:hypothetical protein, partial [Enterococcus faecium]